MKPYEALNEFLVSRGWRWHTGIRKKTASAVKWLAKFAPNSVLNSCHIVAGATWTWNYAPPSSYNVTTASRVIIVVPVPKALSTAHFLLEQLIEEVDTKAIYINQAGLLTETDKPLWPGRHSRWALLGIIHVVSGGSLACWSHRKYPKEDHSSFQELNLVLDHVTSTRTPGYFVFEIFEICKIDGGL